MREKRRGFFFFLGKSESSCSLLAGSRGESVAIAALWYRHRRENAAQGGPATQLVEGCGLWPPDPAYPAYIP